MFYNDYRYISGFLFNILKNNFMKMKHIKTQKQLNEASENLNISDVSESKILCRTCAAYGGCKLDKKGTATKCKNFWEHRQTSDFTK